jgi:hypothetical protein
MAKEFGGTDKGFGVGYKKNVSTRSDKIGNTADAASKQSGTKDAFNKAHTCTKKA